MEKFKNKNSLIVILGIIVICSLIGGTFAWFSWQAEDTTISGTTGAFVIPTTNPINPLETIDIDSHLYEPSTIEEFPKLVPGLTFVKDPYVGIGAGSLDAAVFVYVDNNFSDKVYFELNEGWEVVNAESTKKEVPEKAEEEPVAEEDTDEAEVEEGIAFSPVYHINLRNTISEGEVTTWLKLQKAN